MGNEVAPITQRHRTVTFKNIFGLGERVMNARVQKGTVVDGGAQHLPGSDMSTHAPAAEHEGPFKYLVRMSRTLAKSASTLRPGDENTCVRVVTDIGLDLHLSLIHI